MKYTTDDAHREIISRAHKLDPTLFSNFRSANAHSLRQRQIAEAKANTIRRAAEDFYAEGNEIVGEDEFNEERSAR